MFRTRALEKVGISLVVKEPLIKAMPVNTNGGNKQTGKKKKQKLYIKDGLRKMEGNGKCLRAGQVEWEDTRKKEEEKIHGSSTSQAMLGCGRRDGIMI